ncbi:putative rhamnogalacturonase [Phytophthora rubi]|uniref:Putative rhamnogalacturonase n=1 Tax=Phytophthora rubi TaxID=129364 RepID=A0A6A3H9W8_9STRA|nr:putative rhamnogalacturonase [Phytophthora rubi]KAE8966529.1 putative rhamnogalacturonase [Phytophthora rubi]KAE9274625.1 putative rhamnogalacturonase [Phytophthora rubi]
MLCRLLTAALTFASVVTAAPSTVSAATSFGYTTGSDKYIISTGKGLTVTMKQSTCDITSIKYNGKELQYKSKATHANSGLGKVTSSIKTLSDSKKTIRVVCKATGLEQTYLFRPNENVIYMGTYHSSDRVLPELRFLARLDRTVVNAGIKEATIESGMTAIEAEDVVSNSKGLTRSKYYSGVPFIDDDVHGVKSSAAGVYFVISNLGYETSSGGPFFRDINNKFDVSNELTFYMNSDHTRTEDYRYGFHGPYALAFTSGAAPSASSLDFFQNLGLTGFVPSAKRGKMSGTITDSKSVLGESNVVVGFSNAAAQYWVKVAAGKKTFTSPLMKAGRYTATVYKKQLAVGTASVLIKAGSTKIQSIAVSYNMTSKPIWRIGEWDGTPDGFLNADKIHKMHPSDSRMSAWKALTFKAGSDANSAFPMAQFRGVNDPITIRFSLTAAQAKTSRTLKIGLTLAQSSARSSVTVNGKWTAAVPASVAVKTRGVTRGVTVGNYKLYEYTIPSSALVAGANTIKLTVASGASDPAEKFLAASVVFDALELV